MKSISVLIKPASSLCNISCKYCFYAEVSCHREIQSYGKMTEGTMRKMIDNIYKDLENGDVLTLSFQGGEPTLAGLAFYEKLIQYVKLQKKSVIVHYALQTNGLLIDDKWCLLLKKYDFLVGLSLDGHPIYHDLNRIDRRGIGTFDRVMQTKKLFDDYDIQYNILCVLTNPLAKDAKKIFKFLMESQIKYVQFIPCLDDLYPIKKNSYALEPKRFASFYKHLFELWLKQLKEGNYISIKLFDDLINLLIRKEVTACGILGNCQIQYVIEADGGVYPCDFYVLDENLIGNIRESSLKELFNKEISTEFICKKPVLSKRCTSCSYLKICGGGCKRMREAVYVDSSGRYCGYQDFLKTFIDHKQELLDAIFNIV